MKYCLNSNLSAEYLQKADEIKVKYKDRHEIIDLIEKYPGKTIILTMIGYDGIIDWDEINRLNIMCQNNFIVALNDIAKAEVKECNDNKIKFYWNYPVNDFWTLKQLKKFGVVYALIDSPLTHQVNDVARIGVPIRAVPNVAYYATLPFDNGVIGSWIRPEDLYLYEEFISAVEFEDCDIKKEQALFRIYAEQKAWAGDLGMIITNLDYPGVNRMLPSSLTKRRMNCGQRCAMNRSTCRLCYRYLDLADPDKLRPYLRKN